MAQIDRLKVQLGITNTDEDSLLNEYLEVAKQAILKRRYPYTTYPVDDVGTVIMDARYEDTQLKIAVFLYNKRGAEGQTAHGENGVDRTYENADIPKSYLVEVIPFVG